MIVIWPYRLVWSRTFAFQASNPGSNPGRAMRSKKQAGIPCRFLLHSPKRLDCSSRVRDSKRFSVIFQNYYFEKSETCTGPVRTEKRTRGPGERYDKRNYQKNYSLIYRGFTFAIIFKTFIIYKLFYLIVLT